MCKECNNCRFFRRHIIFEPDTAKAQSVSCTLSGENIENLYNEDFAKTKLYSRCPLRTLEYHEKLVKNWNDLKHYIFNTYNDCDKKNTQKYNVLKDIIFEINKIECNGGV